VCRPPVAPPPPPLSQCTPLLPSSPSFQSLLLCARVPAAPLTNVTRAMPQPLSPTTACDTPPPPRFPQTKFPLFLPLLPYPHIIHVFSHILLHQHFSIDPCKPPTPTLPCPPTPPAPPLSSPSDPIPLPLPLQPPPPYSRPSFNAQLSQTQAVGESSFKFSFNHNKPNCTCSSPTPQPRHVGHPYIHRQRLPRR